MGRAVVSEFRDTMSRPPVIAVPDGPLAPGGLVGPGSSLTGSVSLDLPADFSSVRRARDAVRRVLTGWRADTINDDVVLVASELVANALRHGLGVSRGAGLTPSVPAPAEVRISLVSTGSHVICTVSDPSEAPPVFRDADPLDGSGHGLGLVDSLSLCWGWTVLSPADQRCGKSVWAIFPLGRPARAVGAA